MKNRIVATLLAVLVTGLAGVFGFTVTPDAGVGLALFAWLNALGAPVQVGILVTLLLLVAVPLIAPYTPWTWDDRAIQYRSAALKVFGQIWNAIAGNAGRAANAPADHVEQKQERK